MWAVLKTLGHEGYVRVVSECMKNTKLLSKGVENAGLKLVVKPTLNLVAFRGDNTMELAEKLWRRGWFVSYVPRYDCIRIVVMPHVKKRHIRAFLDELSL